MRTMCRAGVKMELDLCRDLHVRLRSWSGIGIGVLRNVER